MKISKIHQNFSIYLGKPKVLTNPDDFLGPNWKDVINFWLYLDTLSEEEKSEMDDRYCALEYEVQVLAKFSAYRAAEEVVGRDANYGAWRSTWNATSSVFAYATTELIAHHKLLEQDKTLLALPICISRM
jgi:hypothetical protein